MHDLAHNPAIASAPVTAAADRVRRAARIMLEAHVKGVALVIVCPKEQAEFYCERLASFGLTATMERA